MIYTDFQLIFTDMDLPQKNKLEFRYFSLFIPLT